MDRKIPSFEEYRRLDTSGPRRDHSRLLGALRRLRGSQVLGYLDDPEDPDNDTTAAWSAWVLD